MAKNIEELLKTRSSDAESLLKFVSEIEPDNDWLQIAVRNFAKRRNPVYLPTIIEVLKEAMMDDEKKVIALIKEDQYE